MLFYLNTNFIRFLRRTSLLLGGMMIAVTLIWPYLTSEAGRNLKVQKTGRTNGDVLAMENATIQSLDQNKRPVEIIAGRATPNNRNMDEVGLEMPKAKINLADGKVVNLNSKSGEYLQQQNILLLKGDVKFKNSEGYDIRSETAEVLLDTNEVTSDSRVKGFGPRGTLEADGMIYGQDGQRIVLKGKSKLVFDMRQIKQDKADKNQLRQADDDSKTP